MATVGWASAEDAGRPEFRSGLGAASSGDDAAPARGLLAVLEAERDRWFLWVPVLFGLGAGVYYALPSEPRLAVVLAAFAISVVLSRVWQEGTLAVVVCGVLLTTTSGLAAARLKTEWVRAPALTRTLQAVPVAGFVELVEPRATRGQRITLRVVELGTLAPAERPARVRVRTLRSADLHPGDAIRLRATLAPPAIPSLPGDFDFARLAWFSGIGGVGFALSAPVKADNLGSPPRSLAWSTAIEGLRQSITARITAALPGETGAIAAALITGERGGISERTNDAFRDSGLFHILSISGLHMTIMAGAAFFVIRLLLAAVPAIALRYDTKRWAAAGALAAALGYLLISGGAFATVRSYLMISIMFLAVLLGRPAIALRNVALSALAILLLFPESLLDVGFQMSFAAVTALVATYEALREREGASRESGALRHLVHALMFFGGIILSTVIASVAVAPFAAYHFHKSQQLALVANVLAIPVCNIAVMPAALAALVALPLGLEAGPLWIMGLGIEAMSATASWVATLPGAVVRIPAITTGAFLAMVAGGLWLCLWRTRWRLLGLALIVAGVAAAPLMRKPDLIVGRDGNLVALRTDSGALSALASGNVRYEIGRWLENDGDSRPPGEVAAATEFRCDAAGCIASAKGLAVSVVRHPSALPDACASAAILILPVPRPRGCTRPAAVIDFFDMRGEGTHALFVEDGKVRVTTVAAARGERPWTGPRRRPPPDPAARRPLARGTSRLAAFAAPAELAEHAARPRPEIEDEEAPAELE